MGGEGTARFYPWYTRRSVSSRIVLIGSADSLPALRKGLDAAAEVETFPETDALEALDHIVRTKPAVVAMQEEFSATSRGQALINRIKDDPAITAEVRIMAREAAQHRVAAKRGGGSAAVAVDERKPALDQRGTRRAPRTRVKDGVEVAVDGNPAALVDISPVGAQVISPTVLKPNQRVRIQMGDSKHPIKCSGAVAWASFEMPKGQATRYRAGIDFESGANAEGIGKFAQKHKREKEKE
jgi:hypothetical protein